MQQQRTLLEAIPRDLSRPWEDPMPEEVRGRSFWVWGLAFWLLAFGMGRCACGACLDGGGGPRAGGGAPLLYLAGCAFRCV